MPAVVRSASSSFSRGGPRGDTGFVQTRPSEHSEHQYQGFLRGLGVTSKEPICSKRATSIAKLHQATHFAIGCHKWDEGNRDSSVAQSTWTDPQVVYATVDCPDKNSSAVELQQMDHRADIHYRTEQRSRFPDPGPQPKDPPCRTEVSVHLGDDAPIKQSQMHGVHARHEEPEIAGSHALRAAGQGALIPTSQWPKPHRCHPITGGPRSVDSFDLGTANPRPTQQHGRITQNHSSIMWEAHQRNPILGHHVPNYAFETPHMKTTKDAIDEHNAGVPPLRSLSALRPHC